MVTGDNGTTAHQIAKQCLMVTPRMKLYKLGDDEDKLEDNLTAYNT
jgi:magnesium-transporting ATPase (P-type)